jgi:Xaa-Pro dipeptidase
MSAVEVSAVAVSCGVAAHAFAAATDVLRPRLRETHVAAAVRAPLETGVLGEDQRAQGFVFCMSGANAASAYRAYARSSGRRIEPGDLVLIHCNSCVDGYWTDITRTYCLGEPEPRQRAMYDAVFAARNAALSAIRPGVTAHSIDQAARAVLTANGFGPAFKHALGHGVGFAAIDHAAHPHLAPASDDVLEPNMVCNIEPAIYLDGYGGVRHCDVVAVTDTGVRVLTPFQASMEALVADIVRSI